MTRPHPWSRAAFLPEDPDLSPWLHRATAAGFTHVAVSALAERPPTHLDALADSGLFVACARLTGNLTLADVAHRRWQLAQLQRQVADAARLGAPLVWLAGKTARPEETIWLREGLELLARYAAGRRVRVAVEADADTAEVGRFWRGGDIASLRQAGPSLWLVEVGMDLKGQVLEEIGFTGVAVEFPF